MAILGTYNSVNIVSMPSWPAPDAVDYTSTDLVGEQDNEFTGAQQLQDWRSSWLTASVSLPKMTHDQAQEWISFLLSCRGMLNVFWLGDPLATAPRGAATGTPVTSGSLQSGYQLTTSGWTPSTSGILLSGDMLQIGYRLFRVTEDVASDASGNASFSIWPNIRESISSGSSIVTTNSKGLFRLASNDRKWSIEAFQVYGFRFVAREAF